MSSASAATAEALSTIADRAVTTPTATATTTERTPRVKGDAGSIAAAEFPEGDISFDNREIRIDVSESDGEVTVGAGTLVVNDEDVARADLEPRPT